MPISSVMVRTVMFFVRLLLCSVAATAAVAASSQTDPVKWREDGDYIEYHRDQRWPPIEPAMPNLEGLRFDETMHTLLQRQLPFDRPVDLVLDPATRNDRQRFYFQIFKRRENLTLTVTPCLMAPGPPSPQIEIHFIRSKTLKKFRKRKVGRRSKSSLVKMINRRLLNHPLNRRLVLVHHSLAARVTLGADLVFDPGLYIVQVSGPLPPGDEDESSPPASATSTPKRRLQLYLSSFGRAPYPPVPPVATIMTKQVNQNPSMEQILATGDGTGHESKPAVDIWWNPVTVDGRNFEYCLMVNEDRPFEDQCLAPEGSLSAKTVADADPFLNEEDPWFWTEAELRHRSPAGLGHKLAYHRCWPGGGQSDSSKVTVPDLKANQLYFVDVFVRDMDRPNLVSKYWTANISLMEPDTDRLAWRHHFYSMQTLHDGLLTGVFLDSHTRYRKRFLYKLQDSPTIHIYLQPCTGIGPIQFLVKQISPQYFEQADRRKRRPKRTAQDDAENLVVVDEELSSPDNGMLFFEEITETRTVEITVPGWSENRPEIFVEMELNTLTLHQSRSLVLLASQSLARFPFPRLPADKTIRAMETLAQCDSVTLVWNASPDERVTYCIMQRDAKYGVGFEESAHFCQKIRPPSPMKRNSATATDHHDDHGEPMVLDAYGYAALISSQPTRKVLCRRYKARKRVNNLIMQQVRKLHPGRQYIFLVTIKARQHTLHYEQVWAETKSLDQCSSSSSDGNRNRRRTHN